MVKFEKAKVFNVLESIAYAEGGVVSRELVHNDAGSVTLFSFDQGQGLSEHQAPYDALLQVLEGKLELTVDGRKFVIATGESLIIPQGARHALHAPGRLKMQLTMIRGQQKD